MNQTERAADQAARREAAQAIQRSARFQPPATPFTVIAECSRKEADGTETAAWTITAGRS